MQKILQKQSLHLLDNQKQQIQYTFIYVFYKLSKAEPKYLTQINQQINLKSLFKFQIKIRTGKVIRYYYFMKEKGEEKYWALKIKEGIIFKNILKNEENQTILKILEKESRLRGLKKIQNQSALKETLSCIQQHNVQTFDGSNWNKPEFLLYISGIRFINLFQLNLSNNGIESLEVLPRISMYYMKVLLLDCNALTSVKSLRRAFLPYLSLISVDGNYLNEYAGFSEGDHPKLLRIIMEYPMEQSEDELELSPQDLSFFSKLKSQKINKIVVSREDRIRQTKVSEKVESKLQSLKFVLNQLTQLS